MPGISPEKHIDNVRRITWVLSSYDPETLKEVDLSVADPADYARQFAVVYRFKPTALYDPIYAAHSALLARGRIRFVDWRSEPDELMEALDPLVEQAGLEPINWAFVDELAESDNPDDLKSANLLNKTGDQIAAQGWVLVHLFMGWDNLDFAVITPEQYEQIRDIAGSHYGIRNRFG